MTDGMVLSLATELIIIDTEFDAGREISGEEIAEIILYQSLTGSRRKYLNAAQKLVEYGWVTHRPE